MSYQVLEVGLEDVPIMDDDDDDDLGDEDGMEDMPIRMMMKNMRMLAPWKLHL